MVGETGNQTQFTWFLHHHGQRRETEPRENIPRVVELRFRPKTDGGWWHLLDGGLEVPEHVHEDDEEMGNHDTIVDGGPPVVDVVPRKELEKPSEARIQTAAAYCA